VDYAQSNTYWSLFVGAFLAVAIWESFRPRKSLSGPADRRWGRHMLLLAVSTILVKVLVRMNPVAVAAMVANSAFGVLNKPWLPFGARFVTTLLLLDLTRYLMHRAYHAVGFLWRIHELHHSDPEYDVSTAGRFHPLEVLIDQAGFLAVIAMLAPPVTAVFASELITLVINFFVHANASLPRKIERVLRAVIITPDLHRIHHSEEMEEQWRNLGQTFSWWDKLFGSYLDSPAAGEDGLITGVQERRNTATIELGLMLAEPFRPRPQQLLSRAAAAEQK
jgi:sterol desaturase/sphingolipid hydroxylase (fatty acid hydroxylase superfamily)